MNRKIAIISFIVYTVVTIASTLIWAEIKSREVFDRNPELFVRITDVKADFYHIWDEFVWGPMGGWYVYRANVSVTVSNSGYQPVIAYINVSTHWTIKDWGWNIDQDIKRAYVEAHSSATVVANVTVGIYDRFEDYNISILNVTRIF